MRASNAGAAAEMKLGLESQLDRRMPRTSSERKLGGPDLSSHRAARSKKSIGSGTELGAGADVQLPSHHNRRFSGEVGARSDMKSRPDPEELHGRTDRGVMSTNRKLSGELGRTSGRKYSEGDIQGVDLIAQRKFSGELGRTPRKYSDGGMDRLLPQRKFSGEFRETHVNDPVTPMDFAAALGWTPKTFSIDFDGTNLKLNSRNGNFDGTNSNRDSYNRKVSGDQFTHDRKSQSRLVPGESNETDHVNLPTNLELGPRDLQGKVKTHSGELNRTSRKFSGELSGAPSKTYSGELGRTSRKFSGNISGTSPRTPPALDSPGLKNSSSFKTNKSPRKHSQSRFDESDEAFRTPSSDLSVELSNSFGCTLPHLRSPLSVTGSVTHQISSPVDDESVSGDVAISLRLLGSGPVTTSHRPSPGAVSPAGSSPVRPDSKGSWGGNKQYDLNLGADENLLSDNMSFTADAAVAVPFTWEAQPGMPKIRKDKSFRNLQLQLPPARTMVVKGLEVSSPNSPSLHSSARDKGSKKQSIGLPFHMSKRGGDRDHFEKSQSFSIPSRPPQRNSHSGGSDDFYYSGSMDFEYKYHEDSDSPVSILKPLPSPPPNSKQTPPGPVSRAPFSTTLPRSLGSSASTSPDSSPRPSTSSSARYMGNCLIALQAALAADPERSLTLQCFDESLAELTPFMGREEENQAIVSSKPSNPLNGNSKVWSGVSEVGSEPESEYEPAMNLKYRNVLPSKELIIRPPSEVDFKTSEINSPTSTMLVSPAKRAIRESSRVLRVSVDELDEYAMESRNFSSDQSNSWTIDRAAAGDSIDDSIALSQCTIQTGHQMVPWEDQQADLTSTDRTEEVVQSAINGLRFTYSPVPNAFAFTRSNKVEAADAQRQNLDDINQNSNNLIVESSRSHRFSIRLDSARSVGSDDFYSVARASDVTELRLSRAESWSRVAQSLAFVHAQQSYQDAAIPLNFLKNGQPGRGGYAENMAVVAGFNPQTYVDCKDAMAINRRTQKKIGASTKCLPFRYILRSLTTFGDSSKRSKIGRHTNMNAYQPRLQPPPVG